MRHSGTEFYTGKELDYLLYIGTLSIYLSYITESGIYVSEIILGQIISVLSVIPHMVSEFNSRVIYYFVLKLRL